MARSYEEDGRTVRDACYHCGNTGKITRAEADDDYLDALAEGMGYDRAREIEKANEEFGLSAAENMMSVHDYRTSVAWDYSAQARKALDALPDWMRRSLLKALRASEKREDEPQGPAPVSPAPVVKFSPAVAPEAPRPLTSLDDLGCDDLPF